MRLQGGYSHKSAVDHTLVGRLSGPDSQILSHLHYYHRDFFRGATSHGRQK